MRSILVALVILAAPSFSNAQGVISTIAGNGTNASTGDGGPATSASLRPNGIARDNAGNIYVSDLAGNVIRKINTAGIISTVAGNGRIIFGGDGGPATSAALQLSTNHDGIAVDNAGNLYIADYGGNRVRKVDTSGIIRTVAGGGGLGFSGDGGPATSAALVHPSGVTVDNAGNIYFTDTGNGRVRKVDTSGIITTIAGNGTFPPGGDGGPATSAALFSPVGVAVDNLGNVYIADENSNSVRKVNAAGIISTVAGNGTVGLSGDGGPATQAAFNAPYSVAVDDAGNLYISDFGNSRLRKVNTAGIVTTMAGGPNTLGDGGPPTSATVRSADVVLDPAGNVYIADMGSNRIRKITIGATVPGLSAAAASLYFSAVVGGNTPGAQVLPITTAGAVPLNFSMSVSTTSGGNWLSATIPGGRTPSLVTVSVGSGLTAGTYKGAVVFTPVAPDLPPISVQVTYSVSTSAPARPAITANGVVNAASFEVGIASNSWITIQGTNLASTTDNWNNAISSGDLPTSLDGVTVTFTGRPGYISYISPTQINVLTPEFGSAGGLVVTNSGATSNLVNPTVKTVAPAFFLWPGNQAVATRQDFSLAAKPGTFAGLTTIAAKPGDVIILWGTGFGATTPVAPLGVQLPSDKTYSTATTPAVTVNNVSATVYGAALAPGFAGLYQVAIQVPTTLADGDWPVVASIGGVQSTVLAVLAVRR
jgi:uncharacterized protein (TIGR03437 family)